MNNHLEHDLYISQDLPLNQYKKVRKNIGTWWHGRAKLVEKSDIFYR